MSLLNSGVVLIANLIGDVYQKIPDLSEIIKLSVSNNFDWIRDINVSGEGFVYIATKNGLFQSRSSVTNITDNSINNSLLILPNPVDDYLLLNRCHIINGEISKMKIYDIFCKQLLEIEIIEIDDFFHINMKGLSAGYYFILINTYDNKTYLIKLIKR